MNKKKILIFGSCVSRDALEYDYDSNFELIGYFARSSLASLQSIPYIDQNLLNRIDSKFQKRVVEYDMKKSFWSFLRMREYDIFLMDLIDERFHLVDNSDGSYLTYSNEYREVSTKESKLLNRYHEKKFNLWKRGLDKLVRILQQTNNMNKLIINKVYWTNLQNNGNNISLDDEVKKANDFLEKMYTELEKYIPSEQFIIYSQELLYCDTNHKWGISNFHYNDHFYEYTIKEIRKVSKLD